MQTDQSERLLSLLLEFGDMMVNAGAEIHRVEDTLTRIGCAYGARKISVLVITASIIITADLPAPVTQTKRIRYAGGTDYRKLAKLNQLSRHCCSEPLALDELDEELSKIRSLRDQTPLYFLGGFLASGASAVFFGGSWWDGLASALFALLVCFLTRVLSPVSPNRMFFNLLVSFLTGLAIRGAVLLIPSLHGDMIMIGDIMLLIPGIAVTNAVRDMFAGDTISGVMRLVECLLWTMAIAGGFMLAVLLTGGF